MNLKQLEVFLAVAESGSFSRGAEATFITQSTVSQHIAALESELGIRLLDRTSRGALLTEGGKVLLDHARRVVTGTHEIEQAIKRFKGLDEVILRVGASNIPGDYMVPAALPRFLDRYPAVRLTLLQGDSRDILDKVSGEVVEIGIVGSRFDEEGISFAPLGRDEIKIVAGSAHPLAGRADLTFGELLQQRFIMREAGSGTAKTVREALAAAGFSADRLDVRAALGSNEAVKAAVGGNLGLSFISDVSIRRELQRGELVELPVAGLTISRTFYLVTRSGRELSPAALAFVELMREIYG